MKRTLASIGAIILALSGAVFFFQGIGILKGSPMTDQTLWAIIGPILILVAIGLFWWGNRPSVQVKN